MVCVSVAIDDVYTGKGAKTPGKGRTAISDLVVLTAGPWTPDALATLAAAIPTLRQVVSPGGG